MSKLHLKSQNFPKPLVLLFSFSLLLVISYSLLVSPVRAQVPLPYVSCDDTDSPEFQSLRPYQKSPCNRQVQETARFCGNRLVLTDSVAAVSKIPPWNAKNCTSIGTGRYRCSYNISGQTANYQIDLSGANFPIMGNTEDVINSRQQTDSLDSADKTNEYVSWYLQGVTNKAEYSFFDPENPEDVSNLVNFSGPLRKLLPERIQRDARETTIKSAGETRHDQVVGCVYNLLNPLKKGQIIECYPGSPSKSEVRLSDWLANNHLPPKEENFRTFQDYWVAYERWRGKSCLRVLGVSLCVDNPFKPNYWGNLFQNIPFSSTEDRVGEVSVNSQSVTPASENLTIANARLTTTPAELYFAHTEEVADLASTLQLTFVPEGLSTTGQGGGVSPSEDCDLKNIRTNKGDDLFAEAIRGTLSYDATFTCDFDAKATSQSCRKDVSVGLGVVTKTPKADELWSRLVGGPASVFKRIFPKVGVDGPILGLLDMPAATKVTYSGSGLVSAGNPGARAGTSAELYFPHIGGISEYFLKGIQTILRPKGFGEQIISGEPGTFTSSGDVNCDQNAPDVSLRNTIGRQDFFQLALNWVGGQTGTHALECYNDTVGRARDAGINPALALLIWLHESDASNYDISVQDFGVASPAPVGYVDQINEFFARARRYTPSSSLCAGRSVNAMQAFAYIYRSGICDPNGADGGAQAFYEALVSGWGLISGCPFPASPTDTSCP